MGSELLYPQNVLTLVVSSGCMGYGPAVIRIIKIIELEFSSFPDKHVAAAP
jgi:hypothetical protein